MANKLYDEESVKAIAESIRLKRDSGDDTYTLSEMCDAVLCFPTTNVPPHHVEEARRVAQKLSELKTKYPHHIVFGTIADTHVDKTLVGSMASARHAVYALEAVGRIVCDFVANLGDNVVGINIDNEADYANEVYMEQVSRYAMTELKSFNLVGNHEKSVSTQKLYDLIGKHNTFDVHGATKTRGFGYTDFADKKVRVIALNTCDYWNRSAGNGMSYEQKDFLMKALDLSDKEHFAEWTIIVLSHIPLDFLGGDFNKGADLKAILKAYDEGTSVSIEVNSNYASAQNESDRYSGTITYNYAGKNAPKVINIHGHLHNNKYGKLKFIDDSTELNIVRVTTLNSSNAGAESVRYTEYGDYSITSTEASNLRKVTGTKADTSATFYFIDLDGQVIYSVGYGADIDRTIVYKDATVYSISYNLTDVTSNNTAAAAVEGSAYTATLSVGKDYMLDTVTVTMGGVDITSEAYADGVVSIPNVTGDIVITATAKDNYVPHWDIADRTAVTDLWKTASDKKDISRNHYYYGVCDSGVIYGNRVSDVTVSGNDITFQSSEKNYGIGVPYHLEAGAAYTFSATASVKARLRKFVYNADGTFVSESAQYSSSGTSLTLEFTAPADATQWVVLMLDTYTANESVTYSNISIVKK